MEDYGYIAAFDIGTTGCKGVLVGRDGRLDYEAERPLATSYGKGVSASGEFLTVEQNPEQWYEAVVSIAKDWWAQGVKPEHVKIIAMSGQMQDCIPIDEGGLPVRPAILYSDTRAADQAERIVRQFGNEQIRDVTGNHIDGSIPIAKLLWMKEHEADLEMRTECVLISSKDYVIRRLTGNSVTDPTSAATAGMMELSSRTWRTDWLEALGLDPGKLPQLIASEEAAGEVLAEAAIATGFVAGTPVVCGVGDAGASTIGAGVVELGDMYIYLGTTGWVAATVARPGFSADGVFHLSHAERGLLIAIAPLMNAGNAHKWAVSVFGGNIGDGDHYDEFEREAASCNRADNNLLFLPYLNGERCPVQDSAASGSFVGLRTTTTRAEMGCAVLEGVALAMRQVTEILSAGRLPEQLTLIGGGSRSQTWCQIFADVYGAEVVVPGEAQYLPALGCASAGFVWLGWAVDYADFSLRLVRARTSERYSPIVANREAYERKYAQYVKLYPTLASLFE